MITTVAITSYNLDCYPEGSGEVAAWINFARTTGKYIFTTHNLIKLIQAAICFFAYLLIIFMQLYGKKMRERAGPLRFKTD